MCHTTSLERFTDLPLSPLTSLWLDILQQTNTSHYSKMDQAQPDEITLASMTMTMENNPVSNHDAALESSSNPVLDEIHVRIRSEQFRARDRIDRLQRIREQRTARLNASRSRLSALGVGDKESTSLTREEGEWKPRSSSSTNHVNTTSGPFPGVVVGSKEVTSGMQRLMNQINVLQDQLKVKIEEQCNARAEECKRLRRELDHVHSSRRRTRSTSSTTRADQTTPLKQVATAATQHKNGGVGNMLGDALPYLATPSSLGAPSALNGGPIFPHLAFLESVVKTTQHTIETVTRTTTSRTTVTQESQRMETRALSSWDCKTAGVAATTTMEGPLLHPAELSMLERSKSKNTLIQLPSSSSVQNPGFRYPRKRESCSIAPAWISLVSDEASFCKRVQNNVTSTFLSQHLPNYDSASTAKTVTPPLSKTTTGGSKSASSSPWYSPWNFFAQAIHL